MQGYKEILAERLTQAVKLLFADAEQTCCTQTSEGFFCDYDMPPLRPLVFAEITKKLEASDLSCAFACNGFSGVYRDGDASGSLLQRIYVAAFATAAELQKYQAAADEALQRDHKIIGGQQKLFSTSVDIGQGLILWHPKGALLRHVVESFGQEAHLLNDYEWVYTPHIGRAALWNTSGHLDFYKDSMYSPIMIDQEEYYLKPMNCPFHIQIYNSEIRSYRELPVRYAEYGTVYRYELSGALNGLTRVRGFTQDDAHIICTPGQIEAEVARALRFSLYILRAFGLDQFDLYISTKPKKKCIGTDNDWKQATEILKKAIVSAGLSYQIDEGGGAFYGPKIDLKLRDALCRQWQCSTIQFDFNLPNRFGMFYIGNDGHRHIPYMIHRALFGSLERFLALLIEHYRGDFPFWLAPVQCGIVPIGERHSAYAQQLRRRLQARGLRVQLLDGEGHMRKKIKKLELEKVPYILVVGDKEVAAATFCVRGRKEGSLGEMRIDSFIDYLQPQMEQGCPIYVD